MIFSRHKSKYKIQLALDYLNFNILIENGINIILILLLLTFNGDKSYSIKLVSEA